MLELLRTAHFVVLLDDDTRIIRRIRTAEPFAGLDDVTLAYDALARTLDAVDRARYAILVDLRQAPARNDDAYEALVAPYHDALYVGFRRVAVLVRSAAGRLQLLRFIKPVRQDSQVFTDEGEARSFLSA